VVTRDPIFLSTSYRFVINFKKSLGGMINILVQRGTHFELNDQ
jgi:hypothetical protein